MEIADTILAQLLYGYWNKVRVMSWGAHDWEKGTDEKQNEFIQFKVNGMLFKGRVRITYMPSDTYTLTFYKKENGMFINVEELEDVYFDELNNTIDERVEKRKDYKF